jgi:N-formylglutamate amidohydrolase
MRIAMTDRFGWRAYRWPLGKRLRQMSRLRPKSVQDEVLEGYVPHEPELDPPFEVAEPARLAFPLVFSSPHSGNVYPRRFLAAARLEEAVLRHSEDAFVDLLFGGAAALGAPLIRARFPRAYLDLNREPYELDPRMFDGALPPFANTRSLRVAGGLGTIARVASQAQEIYARRMPVEEAIERIDKLYMPYHACLAKLIERARRVFGIAVLVDCHSMPSTVRRPGHMPLFGELNPPGKPDVVVGDRFGTSCDAEFVGAVEQELRRCGYVVQRNKPYAGGYITEHYGDPANDCHALQIEVNRALYMDESGLCRGAKFETVAMDLTRAAAALAEAVARRIDRQRAAAE